MDFTGKYNLLCRIAQFIREEHTGSAEELATKCEIKTDRLYDCINVLREFTGIAGAKILYDDERKTYYFFPKGKFTEFKFVAEKEW